MNFNQLLKIAKAEPTPFIVASRLANVSFLTNKNSTSTAPNTNGDGGWITCYYSETAKGDWYTVTCNTNYQTPLTRQFGIAARVEAIELREVQIYGPSTYVFTLIKHRPT